MKLYKYIFLIFVFVLFVNGSCEEGQRFIIQNNSEQEIIIVNAWYPIPRESNCLKSGAPFEYKNFIRDRMIKPHSSINLERVRWGESMISRPNDTLYIGVFYRTDIDRMSCEEFEQKFPLKKEWKVTLSDMIECDWTLSYTSEE